MAIRQEDVERVRQSTDIVTLIGERVALKRSGRQYMGICPFHSENSPSMSVSGEKGFFHCFGCQKHGDAITFVREIDHLDFVQAVEMLAARAGIEIQQETDENAAAERKEKAQLQGAMGKAVDWYHERLLTAPDAGSARAYLRDRGYDGEIVRKFQIGWAPDDWDQLNKALRLPQKVSTQTGLGFSNSRGRVTDSFRARIMFPIFDSTGKPVAFGGRILPGSEQQAKYKNSAETPLYSKSRTLYALNWAKTDIVASGEVIVCEGYTDVIGFFQAGLPRAVATCGTALTESHVRVLTNFAKRIVLAFDADSAGQNAASRFYEWEQKLGIDVVVADMPAGTDPAELGRRNPQALKDAVQNAKSFLAFRLDRVLNSADLRAVEGRARAAEQGVAIVAEQPNQLVRDQYLMTIADRCRVPVEDLRKMLATGKYELPSKPVVDIRARRQPRNDPPEVERAALKVAIQHPEQTSAYFNTVLPEGIVPGVEDVLFEDPRAQAAFRALIDAPTFLEAVDTAEPEAGELLGRLVMEEESGTAAEEFIRLVDRAAHRVIRELEVEVRVRPDGFAEIGPTLAWLKLTVEQLRARDTVNEASAALIGWLMSELQPQ